MKAVAIIPVFNHGKTLRDVIEQVRQLLPELPVMVVNDGSTDQTAEVLQEMERGGRIQVLTHARNQGKGAALSWGFRQARDEGYTHALTVDADGQHHIPDALRLLDAARGHPDDLVIGARDFESGGANVPARSKKGRDMARFWLQVQTGQDIPDSQCGLRVYPLNHVTAARYRFLKFDFETEVLARLAWGGVTIRSVPITCIYFPPERRVSHYRPVIDTIRGVRVNIFLVTRRLMPLPFRRLVKREHAPVREVFGAWWRAATWRDAVRRMIRTASSNEHLSTAIAVGVFLGLTPTFPLQTVLAVYVAQRLHLNILATVLGSQISIPPLMPIWWFLYLQTGNVLLRGEWLTNHAPQLSAWSWANVMTMLGTVLVGSTVVALAVGTISLFVVRAVLGLMRPVAAKHPSG